MGYPTSQSEFDEGVDKMKPEVQKVQDKIDDCSAKTNDVREPSGFWETAGKIGLSALFPIAGVYFAVEEIKYLLANNDEVREKLEQAASAAADLALEIGKLLSPGNPFIMKVVADNWDAVNENLTGVLAPLDDGKFRAITTWTDAMGERYSKVPAGQKAALEGLIPHVDSMRTLMRDHADTIIQLWWDIYEEIFDFVTAAIVLASGFIQANPLKWVEIAEQIAECVAEVLTTVKDLIKLVFDFTMESNGQIETLKANSSNVTGTDFGKWPKAIIA